MSTNHVVVDDDGQVQGNLNTGDQCPNCKYYEECDISFEDCQLNPVNQVCGGKDCETCSPAFAGTCKHTRS